MEEASHNYGNEAGSTTHDPDVEDALNRPVSARIEYGIGGKSRGHVRQRRGSFRDLYGRRLSRPRKTSETLAEYLALPVEQQDALKSAPGFLVLAIYQDGRRKREFLTARTGLSLDIDHATPELFARLLQNGTALAGWEHALYATRKHSPEAPRLRILAPFSRLVTPDEYEALSRILAHEIDPTMDAIDAVSYRPSQIMYFASCSSDSQFVARWHYGAPIDPDAIFARFRDRTGLDPLDFRNLPYSEKQGQAQRRARMAENPFSKPGVIGAWCRAVPIEDAFLRFLFEDYTEGEEGRFSFLGGTATNGIVFHADGFVTSFHGSDPLSGRTVNAFDAVRIVLYGDLDAEASAGTAMRDLPSFRAMDKLARGLSEVMVELEAGEAEAARKRAEAALDDDPDAGMVAEPGAAPLLSPERRAADALTIGGDAWAGARHADRMRGSRLYVTADDQWLTWSEPRWAAQNIAETDADAKETTAVMLAEVAKIVRDDPSPENRRTLGQLGKIHASLPAQRRMVESARSEPEMHVDSIAFFDADPYALTCLNGILDLRTTRLRPAHPEDRVSKLAGAAFDPAAEAPMFLRFLEAIMPDPELRAFLQRAAGYTATGLIDEEVFFVCHGTGANGKSVLANILAAVLGEYVGTFGSALVTRGRNENEGERMKAALPGKRLALVNETAQGDLWDSARIKELSSREKMQARQLYREPFAFMPAHKLWIRTNHLPGSLDPGDGFWRRCIAIPFTTQIPEVDRIPDLDRQIIAKELPGVLNWVAEGAREWLRGKLRVPAAIRAEVASYREETDLIGQWMTERTISDAAGRVTVADAYRDYAEFCRSLGAHFGTAMVFGRAMTARGEKRDPHKGVKTRFMGFRLRPAVEAGFDDDCEALL